MSDGDAGQEQEAPDGGDAGDKGGARLANAPLITFPTPESSGIDDAFNRLAYTLSSFRYLLVLTESVEKKDSPPEKVRRALAAVEYEIGGDALSDLAHRLLQRQAVLLRQMLTQATEHRVTEVLETGPGSEEGMKRYNVPVVLGVELDEDAVSGPEWDPVPLDLVAEFVPNGVEPEDFRSAIHRSMARVDDRGLALCKSLLMAAVSAFESFLSQSAARVLELFPECLKDSGRTFSAVDVMDAPDIETLREAIAEDKLSRLGRRGFSAFDEFFECVAGIGVRAVREVVERRNVVVHHDSHVSAQYVAAVKSLDVGPDMARPPSYEEGDVIGVSRHYLSKALRELEDAARDLAAAVRQREAGGQNS